MSLRPPLQIVNDLPEPLVLSLPAIGVASDDLNIGCDVGMDQIHLLCPPANGAGFARVVPIANRTEAIRDALNEIRQSAGAENASWLRIVVEPTGLYYHLLTRMARSMGLRTALVNAEHVVKMRTVVFGDSGKTDRRDPHAIAAVAERGRVIIDRILPEVYQLLRGREFLHSAALRAVLPPHAVANLRCCEESWCGDRVPFHAGKVRVRTNGRIIQARFDSTSERWVPGTSYPVYQSALQAGDRVRVVVRRAC